MFKLDRLYGDGKVYDVEYFEVGRRQFRQFCSPLDNIILSLCPRVRRNDYVVISAWSSFGDQPSYVDYEHTFRSLDRAIGFVHNMQESNLICCQMRSDLNHGRHYEIWHINDDDELWNDWDKAVADSNIAESELVCDVCCCDASVCASKVVKVHSEKAETKSETIIDKVNRLADEAQDNYALFGGATSGPTDLCDYLGIHWDEYDELTDDAKYAIQDFWRKLVVWDNRYSRFCWNILIDDDMTADLLKHYAGRIWHGNGSVRLREC